MSRLIGGVRAILGLAVVSLLVAVSPGMALGGGPVPGEIAANAQAELVALRDAFVMRIADTADDGAADLTTGWSGPASIAAVVKAMSNVIAQIERDHDSTARKLDKIRDRALSRLEHLHADQGLLDDVILTHSTARGISYSARANALREVYTAVGEDYALLQ